MFEDVIVAKDGNKLTTVKRVHTDARVSSFTHHPTKLMPVVLLACSCGFEGMVPVPVDFGKKEGDPEVCPNCQSPTVHPDNVTELPTTEVKFTDGSTHTMVGSVSDTAPDQTNKIEQGISAAQVQQMIDDKFGAIMQAISNLKPAAPAAPSAPAASVSTPERAGS